MSRFAFALSLVVALASVICVSRGQKAENMAVVSIGLKNLTPSNASYPLKFVISADGRTIGESKVMKTNGEEDSITFSANVVKPFIDLYKQDAASGKLEKILNEELMTNANCIYEVSGPYHMPVISKLCIPNYAPSVEAVEAVEAELTR